ncbi:MAG: glycosyltransferase family 2 protein [Acidobacteriota bacterium]|nr:glycosyltransferase family 2 protein [Acidobacteriota bacterium]
MDNSPSTPAVSVIVPAYNVTPFIADALDSLRTQTFRDFETIVVNDGCPDTANLERVLEPYRSEIVYIRQENRGLAGARNTAIRAARAPLVALLDSDDAWEPDYLEVQTGFLAEHAQTDVVSPNAFFVGETPFLGKTVTDLFPTRGPVSFGSLLARDNHIFVGVTVRREAILRAGLFDPALRSAEDLDLWLRMAHGGASFMYHGRPLVRYRARPDSLSNDPIWIITHVLQVYRKLSETLVLSLPDRACLEGAIRREEANLDFYLGKKALYSGRIQEARERLGRANEVLRNRKTTFALLALRIAPGLLHKMVRWHSPTEYEFLH